VANRWTQAATILRPEIRVCGVRLLPFCLRHRVALEAIDSPVLLPDQPLTAKHMIAAVRILSTHNLEHVRRPHTLRETWWIGRLTFSNAVLAQEAAKLAVYLNAQSLWPRFWSKDEAQGRSGGVPWPLAIVANLTRNGCSLTEAWTMPEAEAVWLHVANTIASGARVDVVSDVEWEAMERHKAEEAAKPAKVTPGDRKN
jgi:hypothetical protein